MRMFGLTLAVAAFSVLGMAQTVPMIKEDGPPPAPAAQPVLHGATADTITVPQNVLQGLAVSEPDISARDEAPQPSMVWLKVLVSKTGSVEEAVVVRGQGELPKVAAEGVMGWTYRPYVVDGQAREIQSTILLQFRDGVGKRAVMSGIAGMLGMGGPMGGVAGMLGGSPPPAFAPTQLPDGSVRVGAGVIAGLMEHAVAPVYPPIAKAAHVQGVVVLHAIISKEGDIEDLKLISGPPMLVPAAMDAVRQWKYRPYMLQGEPVAVETTINVNFTFADSKKPDAAGATGGTPAGTATPDPK